MNRGKIVIILYIVLLSIQIVSADTLNLTASTNETFADNRTAQITANLTNTTGYPVSSMRVNFTTDSGILSAGYNYTNASGIAVVNISSWDLCTAKITAEAPNAANATVNVTFVRGPISRIILSANSSGTVNTTHLIEATAYDNKWRVMPNVLLNFTITPPPTTYNSASIAPPINTTDLSGYTTATARIDKRAGTNHIYVNVTNEDAVVVAEDMEIVGLAGEATNITVTASPENVSANGIGISHITGKVTDGFGNPLLSTGAIQFNIPASDPVLKPLNSVGTATISIGLSKFTGNVAVNGIYINVIGDYTNLTDSATVIFYAEEPARVVVTADATEISISSIRGVNISTITATVIDKWGHTLPGRTVNFNLTGPGTLSSATGTTDSHGQVTITLQSDTSGGATVVAKALNDSGYEIEGNIVILILSDSFVSIITTIEPDPVEPGGIINVTTSVSGQGNITGTRFAAHAMLTLDRSGSMDPDYYAGTPLDVVLVMDVSGSMDPDYMLYQGYSSGAFSMDGSTPYDYSVSASVTSGCWWNDTFVVEGTPVNDFNIRLDWGVGGDNDLRLQLVSPGGLVYGYQGTASGYDYYNLSGERRECIWIDKYDDYSHLFGADVDAIEQGTWIVRVYGNVDRSFSIATNIERLSAVKIASKEFNKNMPSNARVGLVSFGGSSVPRLITYNLTNDISFIDDVTDNLWVYGGTPTAQAIKDANDALVNNDRPGARPYIILLSDGNPTYALDGSYGGQKPIDDAKNEANDAKNAIINGYRITIYTIGFGTDADGNATLEAIASPDCYYYAATTAQLKEIYYSIAQQISDFDITEQQYGVQGFTPYSYEEQGNVTNDEIKEYAFLVNETINDLKVHLDWNGSSDIDLQLISPSGIVYGCAGRNNFTDDYERTSLGENYSTGGDASWIITTADTHSGTRSVKSGSIGHTSSSWMTKNVTFVDTGSIEFWYRVSSESNYDFFNFHIDGKREIHASGNGTWTHYSKQMDAGTYTFKWEYTKDGGVATGADCVYFDGYVIKNIKIYANMTGYTDSNPEYIWLAPLRGQYPQTDGDTVEQGNWTAKIIGTNVAGTQNFNITTYIDKKSAAKVASHAFIESLDPIRYDRVGLATYSYSSTNETATQESYVGQGNQWMGYFTVSAYGVYYFNLSWADTSGIDLYLYDGITLLDSSNASNPEMVSAALSPGTNYQIVVDGTNVTGNDTQFTINVYSTIETVNSGTAAVPLESITVDIPPVDLNKTFLIVKSSDDLAVDSNAYAFTIRGHFIDNDTIEFTRESSSGEGEVSYFVIQADNIEVQSGTTTFAKGEGQKNVSITAVTDHTTKCFVTLSTSSNSELSNYVHESWVTGELTSNNILTFKRGNDESEVTVDWFVIRFTDNTTVRTGETSWSGASTTTQTISSINTSRTWLYFTSRMDNNGLAHTSIKGEITNQTTLTFSKHSDSTAGTDVRYFVIEFPEDGGATVQSGTASASLGDSTVDIGITPVNRKRALAFVTNDCEGTGTAYAIPYWISYFTSDNNLKMQRWYTGEPVVHKWQVVEWPEGTSVSIADTPVNWLEWQAQIDNSLTDSIVSFDPINATIDTLTADGMTAIDEGLYEANNALYDYFAAVSKPIDNSTIILMTDGIDNVGYHSMIAEAERAAANNTTIFTVGFGSDIDDRVLRQIANITGGEYYFAPNATVLNNIFVGIAGVLGNFTAPEPRIDIQIGNNATVEGAFANATYINNSANVTYFNCTCKDCSEGNYGYEHSNPNITYIGNRTRLSWDIGNRPDRIITVGKYWNVTYQLRIDNESAGYVPIVLYPSCVTYEGAGGEGNCSNNLVPDANVDVVGNGTDASTLPADSIELANKAVSDGPPTRKPSSPQPDTVREYAYQLTASLKDEDGDPVTFGTVVEFKATSGTLYNYTLHNTSGLLNGTTGLGGAAIVWLSSDVPGTITVCAYHTTANGTELTPACNVVIFHSLESPPIIPPAPRPRGVITLESDPFMTDWLSLLWRNR